MVYTDPKITQVSCLAYIFCSVLYFPFLMLLMTYTKNFSQCNYTLRH